MIPIFYSQCEIVKPCESRRTDDGVSTVQKRFDNMFDLNAETKALHKTSKSVKRKVRLFIDSSVARVYRARLVGVLAFPNCIVERFPVSFEMF